MTYFFPNGAGGYSTINAAPVTYQWFTNGTPIPGATNSSYSIASAQGTNSGTYKVTASTGLTASSTSATLLVDAGSPIILTNPAPVTLPVGETAVFTVDAIGAPTLTYQWMSNNIALNDIGQVSGSHASALTIANCGTNDSASYSVLVANGFSPAATSAVATLNVTLINFNNGAGWTANGHAAITNGVLGLTDGGLSETSSLFLDQPVDIQAFLASWTYQANLPGNTNLEADGTVFVLQNSPAGVSAIGGGGGQLGYVPSVSNSVALEFNLYTDTAVPYGPGISFTTNGAAGYPYSTPGLIALTNGDPIGVTLEYLGGVLSLTLTDSVAQVSFSTNIVTNIVSLVGSNMAYVGFTGASGGVGAAQTVSNFFFTSLPTLTIQNPGNGSLILSWPIGAAGFTLQRSSSLSSPNWVALPNAQTVANGQNQVTVTPSGADLYYRLVIQ
jgi:hypothetical protein